MPNSRIFHIHKFTLSHLIASAQWFSFIPFFVLLQHLTLKLSYLHLCLLYLPYSIINLYPICRLWFSYSRYNIWLSIACLHACWNDHFGNQSPPSSLDNDKRIPFGQNYWYDLTIYNWYYLSNQLSCIWQNWLHEFIFHTYYLLCQTWFTMYCWFLRNIIPDFSWSTITTEVVRLFWCLKFWSLDILTKCV